MPMMRSFRGGGMGMPPGAMPPPPMPNQAGLATNQPNTGMLSNLMKGMPQLGGMAPRPNAPLGAVSPQGYGKNNTGSANAGGWAGNILKSFRGNQPAPRANRMARRF